MTAENVLLEDTQWKAYYRFLGFMAIVLFAIIPFQAAVYFIAPPPKTIVDFFKVYQRNWMLGLLDLDLSLTVDNLIFMLVYIGFYNLLKKYNKPLATVGLVAAIISIILYVVSREGLFSMMSLSGQYFAAASDAEKTAIATIGQAMLTIFNGTCFDVSYVLGGVAIIIFSIIMIKGDVFTKATGWTGFIMGVLMLVPPTAGQPGFILSFLSLLPLMVWLIMIALRFFKLGKKS